MVTPFKRGDGPRHYKKLSPQRHEQIFSLVGEGYTDKEIAETADLSEQTAKVYINSVKTQGGFTSRHHMITCYQRAKVLREVNEICKARGNAPIIPREGPFIPPYMKKRKTAEPMPKAEAARLDHIARYDLDKMRSGRIQ